MCCLTKNQQYVTIWVLLFATHVISSISYDNIVLTRGISERFDVAKNRSNRAANPSSQVVNIPHVSQTFMEEKTKVNLNPCCSLYTFVTVCRLTDCICCPAAPIFSSVARSQQLLWRVSSQQI